MADSNDPVETSPQSAPFHVISATDLAPTIFIDGLEGFAYNDAIVKINIFQDVLVRPGDSDKPDNIERRIAAHLVMPHAVLSQIYEWLGRQIADRNSYLRRLAEQREKDQRERET
jgi:hypothetical protein